MYEASFQLDRRPFVAIPSTDDFFPAESIEEARTSLVRLIGRDEGPAVVVGPVGIGKTLLCRLMADTFRSECRVAMVSSGRVCTRRALLQVILHQLGLAFRGMEEGELRLSLIDHVTSDDFCPHGVLLLIDEADSLPMALLDELRTMTNIMAGGRPRIRLVMFGSSRLEEKFVHPRLESFSQRLAGRFYLEPFNREETFEYIVSHFQQCGGNAEGVFSKDALELIYRASNGVPRLINQLCDHALILAAINYQAKVDDELVNEAWADLQQLPTPVRSDIHDAHRDVVEFGDLSEDPVTTATDAESNLDLIERGMADIRSDRSDQDSSIELPAIKLSPRKFDNSEIDEFEPRILRTHGAHNPFDESFEEDEMIVDRFAAASVVSKRHIRRVVCDQSDLIANQLDDVIRQASDWIRSAHDSVDGSTPVPSADDSAVPHLPSAADTHDAVEFSTVDTVVASAEPATDLVPESPLKIVDDISAEASEVQSTDPNDVTVNSDERFGAFAVGSFERFDGEIRTFELPDVLIHQEVTEVRNRPADSIIQLAESIDSTAAAPEHESDYTAEEPNGFTAEEPGSEDNEAILDEEPSSARSIPMTRPRSNNEVLDPRKPTSRNFNRLFSKLRKAN